MRKRVFHERVCTCSPQEGMTFVQAQRLREIVNREIHPIRCASTCGRKAQKVLVLGDLCAEAGYPRWAVALWKMVIREIHDKDYDDWINWWWFNPEYVSFQDVLSDGICEVLGRRIDEQNRRMGLANPHGMDSWEYWAGDGWYDYFRYEKYDDEWITLRDRYVKIRDEAMANQATERIFHDGQGELPPQAQDFFGYWEDDNPLAQDLYFKIDDWDGSS